MDRIYESCDQIQSEGIQPLYFGFKDTWTTLAPWNAIAVSLCDSDLTYQVNSGETTFCRKLQRSGRKGKSASCIWTERSGVSGI